MKMLSRFGAIVLGLVALGLFAAGISVRSAPKQTKPAIVQLSGTKVLAYLEKSGDAKSLAQAITAARFGLRWQEHAPGESNSGGGFLGMSHEQDLNAWFAEDGMTVRPTLPETKRDQTWSMALRLQAWGHGKQLGPIPQIVSRQAKENRIEYQRGGQTSATTIVEWYENKMEGIEQGLTLNERPDEVETGEPLHISLAVVGDLRARKKEDGTIELGKTEDKGALSYSKLLALDADGKRLAATMEASADGREIALVVEDAKARYPIVIDPIVASLEKKLEAFTAQQTDARFGSAVAIDHDTAVVGAWREDFGATPDVGVVYVFTRSGSSWTLKSRNDGGSNAGDGCGWSVAINGSHIVYGCPGANNNSGRAFFRDIASGKLIELPPVQGSYRAGDRFGESVAIGGNHIIVGSPFYDITSGQNDAGLVHHYTFDTDSNLTSGQGVVIDTLATGAHMGASVTISNDGNTVIAGAPGAGTAGQAIVLTASAGSLLYAATLQPSNGKAGDQFGQSVAISGNTAVIGAGTNDDKAMDAGAAYVFVRDQNGNWTQQQELTASDASAYNYFGFSAVAIEGNTIVVGSYGWEPTNNVTDEFGKAYIFTRSGSAWTQQAQIFSSDNNAGDSFGISVGISRDTVIAGARVATATGVARAGAAYVYRLDCVPPSGDSTLIGVTSSSPSSSNLTICAGSSAFFQVSLSFGLGTQPFAYQWRKNGANIPGATSSTYSISNASGSDAGSYDAILSNSCGSDISAPGTLTVQTFSLNPSSQNFGVSGSNGIVNVIATGSTCSWTAVSNASFITVNSGSSGTGNGTVGFTVAANPNSGQRTGSITIAGLTFTVSQDGTNCSYSIAPTSQTLGASASTNTVNVTASTGCTWTATSNDPSFLSVNSGANGSGNGTVTYTTAANSTTSQRSGTLTIAGQTFTVTQAAGGPTELANVSTRLRIETGDNVLFAGFIITGTQPKKVIVLGTGPSLTGAGVPGALADPTLELYQGNTLIDSNNNWGDSPNKQAIIDSGVAPANNLESAIIATLPAGNSQYTAIVRGGNNGTGVGTMQLFDLDRSVDSKLANISTRGLVQTGDNILIAGTIILGQTSQKVIVRAIGPSLPLAGSLQNPTLELRDGNGTLFDSNDNWKESPNKQAIIDSTVAPTNDLESAIVATLPSGGAQYTAIVRGVDGGTGVAVVDVFALN
jgi:hypothetical protein